MRLSDCYIKVVLVREGRQAFSPLLTDFEVKNRAGDEDAGCEVAVRDHRDADNNLPVDHYLLQATDYLAKEEKKGELDRKDGGPAQGQEGKRDLLEPFDPIEKARRRESLKCQRRRRVQDQSVYRVYHDVKEGGGRDERHAAEQQQIVVKEKAALVAYPDGCSDRCGDD